MEFDEVKVKPFNWFRMSENLRSLFLEMIDGNVKGCILSTDNGERMNCKRYVPQDGSPVLCPPKYLG